MDVFFFCLNCKKFGNSACAELFHQKSTIYIRSEIFDKEASRVSDFVPNLETEANRILQSVGCPGQKAVGSENILSRFKRLGYSNEKTNGKYLV